jgi:hypothetical protein
MKNIRAKKIRNDEELELAKNKLGEITEVTEDKFYINPLYEEQYFILTKMIIDYLDKK